MKLCQEPSAVTTVASSSISSDDTTTWYYYYLALEYRTLVLVPGTYHITKYLVWCERGCATMRAVFLFLSFNIHWPASFPRHSTLDRELAFSWPDFRIFFVQQRGRVYYYPVLNLESHLLVLVLDSSTR